ncbi:cell envelope integrity protein TolA [Methylorubrum sp. SL192]|uniref:cell envelope integrity protein TolA n=1 Tax=Methylorubrum sp. SL192 TaxID=2995167 RepID=UPI0022745EA1|nr:cell envelope integrity protein TolA [Methylorubrum sp. SL192]MCY1644472.1 cell envelope integrity protein TolA [Methylorubrum sp. SL192]
MALRWPTSLTESFRNREPGVWISAAVHAVVLGAALFVVAAPVLPEGEEGVPVEVLTEQQFSELTRGELNAEKPENKPNRADRVAEKQEQREPENAKTDAPAAPTRTADTRLAAVDAMPLRADTADPVKEEAEAAAAKAEAAKAEAEKAAAAKAAEAKAKAEVKAKADAAAKAEAAKAEAAKAAEAKAAAAKAEAEKREELQKLVEHEQAEAEAAAKAAEAKAKARAEAKAKADAKAKAEAKAEAEAKAKAEAKAEAEAKAKAEAAAKAEAEAEHRKQVAEAKAKAETDAKAKAEAAAKAKAKAMADARAKADAEAKARQQAELANRTSPGDSRETQTRAASQSTGSTGREVQRTASLGTASGTAQRLSPSLRGALVGMLQQQIERCYSAPPGATQGVVLPMLDIRLNPDGSLTTEPRVMRAGNNSVDQSIAQAALRAVRRCAPFKIPAQYAPYYNDWKAINAEFEFSPV